MGGEDRALAHARLLLVRDPTLLLLVELIWI